MPGWMTADSVARWPGPVTFERRIGSFGSIAASTMRLPLLKRSAIDGKVPAGIAASGQDTSRSTCCVTGAPKRSGALATTTVRVATVCGFVSMFLRRSSAWRLSHEFATNTASRPNTTANPIITMVLVRTAVTLRGRLKFVLAAQRCASALNSF